MLGTVRTLSEAARRRAEAAIARICAGWEGVSGARAELDWIPGVPPTVNDPAVLEGAVAGVRRQLGEVVAETGPTMGAEDFAEIATRVPSFVLRVGSAAPGRRDALHNSDYQPDEGCIALGAQALARAAADLLAGITP
jgi:metal-dependent amidase/aminoacylase/carboxypeptidase family protein